MTGKILLLIAVLGIALYGTSDSYADHSEVVIVPVDGSSVAGCQDEDGCFIPMIATVDVGGVVIFKNTDSVAHTFTAGTVANGPSGEFDSGLALAGSSFEYTAETVGEIQHYCLIHPWASGTIVVQEAQDGNGAEHEPSATRMLSDGTIIEVYVSEPTTGGQMVIKVKYLDSEHVNFDLVVMQNDELILDDVGVHNHDGQYVHTTAPIYTDDPMDITIMFQGFGVDEITGPVGEIITFTGITPAATSTHTISTGTVFSDVNRNAERDAGEAGLEGIIVLCTPHGSLDNVMRITTDSAGSYRFETQSGCYLTQAEISGWTTGDPDAHAYTAEHPGQSMTLNFPSWQSDLCVSGYVLSDGQCTQNQQVSNQLLNSLLATIQLIRDELSGLNSKLDRLNAETDGVSIQLENLRSTVPADLDPVPRDPIDTTVMHITTDRQIYMIGDTVTVTGMVPIAEPLVEPIVYADGSSKSFVRSDHVSLDKYSDKFTHISTILTCFRDYPFDRERFDRLQDHQESNREFGKFYSGEVECPIADDGRFSYSTTAVYIFDIVTYPFDTLGIQLHYSQRGSSSFELEKSVEWQVRAPPVTTSPVLEPNHTIQASLDKTNYVPNDIVIINGTITGHTPGYDPYDVKIVISKDGQQYGTFTEYLNADGSFQFEVISHHEFGYGTYTIELIYFGVKHELEFNYIEPEPEPREPADTTAPYITTDRQIYTLGDTIRVTGKVHPPTLVISAQTLDGTMHHPNVYHARVSFNLDADLTNELNLADCYHHNFDTLPEDYLPGHRDAAGPTQEPGRLYQYDFLDGSQNSFSPEEHRDPRKRTECSFAADGSFSFMYHLTEEHHANLHPGTYSASMDSGQAIRTENGILASKQWNDYTSFELRPAAAAITG